MIGFTCVHCGQAHDRPAEEAGTTFFCDCGQPNLIPWGARKPIDLEPPIELGTEAVVLPAEAGPEAVDVCFQHGDTAATETCADCGVRFCERCVVLLQGAILCGACKNFRVRRLQRPARISALAIVATVLALGGSPIGLCVTGAVQKAEGSLWGLLGSILPLTGLALGTIALVQIERDPKQTGRSLAITGIVTGLVGALLGALVTTFTHNAN